jgi:DNA-binding PadR family transcriptional regulator
MGMSLEAAIMGFLAEQPRSGYDLKTRCFAEEAAAFWTADQAQIYRTLERLQSAGMVACTRQRQMGKPDRKVYRLTAAGAVALASWLATPFSAPAPRDGLLLQLFFSAALTDGEITANLSARRCTHQARLEHLRREVTSHSEHPLLSDRARVLREAAFDGAIAHERASIDWLDDTIEAIESGHLPAADTRPAEQDDQSEAGSA